MEWNARVAAVSEHASRMMKLVFDSWASGTVPVMEPPPPPAGPQPVLPTFEEFVAQRCSTPGPRSTGGSSVGGGGGRESRSPIAAPIHRGGGGAESPTPITPIHRGGDRSGAGSSNDLGFGGLGGDELGGGRPSV